MADRIITPVHVADKKLKYQYVPLRETVTFKIADHVLSTKISAVNIQSLSINSEQKLAGVIRNSQLL